jgi:hypothetical protein
MRALGALIAAFAISGCSGDGNSPFGGYGQGMPGSGLPNGGEVLLQNVHYSAAVFGIGEPVIANLFHAYQVTGFTDAIDTPPQGGCFAFEHPDTFPVNDIPAGARYVDWGNEIRLTGPGVDKIVPKVTAPLEGMVDNRPSPVRLHREGGFIYGGPTWQGANFQDIDLQPGATFSVALDTAELTFNMPPEYEFALDIGTAEIEIPADVGAGLEVTWEALPNPDTPHSHTHSFVFVNFVALPGSMRSVRLRSSPAVRPTPRMGAL